MSSKKSLAWLWWLIVFIILNFVIKILNPHVKELAVALILLGIYFMFFAKLFFTHTKLSKEKLKRWSVFYIILGLILIIIGIAVLI